MILALPNKSQSLIAAAVCGGAGVARLLYGLASDVRSLPLDTPIALVRGTEITEQFTVDADAVYYIQFALAVAPLARWVYLVVRSR